MLVSIVSNIFRNGKHTKGRKKIPPSQETSVQQSHSVSVQLNISSMNKLLSCTSIHYTHYLTIVYVGKIKLDYNLC